VISEFSDILFICWIVTMCCLKNLSLFHRCTNMLHSTNLHIIGITRLYSFLLYGIVFFLYVCRALLNNTYYITQKQVWADGGAITNHIIRYDKCMMDERLHLAQNVTTGTATNPALLAV